MRLRDLFDALKAVDIDLALRVGDVSEGDDLHCSVGKVVLRGDSIVFVPGDDDIWKDESVASDVLSQQLWPEDNDED